MINSKYLRSISVKGALEVFKEGTEESICTKCPLPKEKCNGDCKRFKEEKRKLKEQL